MSWNREFSRDHIVTRSYTFNGTCKSEYDDWIKWMDDAEHILEILGVKPDICAVGSEKDNNIKSPRTIRRSIDKLYERGDKVDSISYICMARPDGYVIFDYAVTITRSSSFTNYVTLIVNRERELSEVEEGKIISLLKENIDDAQGEVYEMKIGECPEMYAAKINSPDFYKTLKVLRKI